MNEIHNKSFFCSWSGGKDSCLALYHAIQNGGSAKYLFTKLAEGGNRNRAHGLPISVLAAQAQSLGISLVTKEASWKDYERIFISAISEFKENDVEYGVFGDIDVEPHLEWVDRTCSSVGINVYEPLWQMDRREIMNEFLHLGFEATIISVRDGIMDSSFLGQPLNHQVVNEIENHGIDACGENGEYHSVVTNGPKFSNPIKLVLNEFITRDGYNLIETNVQM